MDYSLMILVAFVIIINLRMLKRLEKEDELFNDVKKKK